MPWSGPVTARVPTSTGQQASWEGDAQGQHLTCCMTQKACSFAVAMKACQAAVPETPRLLRAYCELMEILRRIAPCS